MKRKILLSITLICGAVALAPCLEIQVNQVAYYVDATKLAVVPSDATGQFEIVDADSLATVFTGALPEKPRLWRDSGETFKMADFSAFTGEGRFFVRAGAAQSPTFAIKKSDAYGSLLAGGLKAFYFWRASTDIPKQFGEAPNAAPGAGANYARAAGHPDDKVSVHPSAATGGRPAGTVISSPKGWYDAGDYNKYVVNAGVSVFFLAHAYESCPSVLKGRDFGIPESGNGVPDILDELKWEYDWLLTTQDTDGGVYFKVTSKGFDAFEMPAADRSPRFAVGKSTTSALDFAAMMAMGYRLFKPFDAAFPGYAGVCLAAAEKAWAWAKANPSIAYKNPGDVYTGEYGDGSFDDEFFWAAAELFISTGNAAYYKALDFSLGFSAPNWGYVAANGLMSLALHRESLPAGADRELILQKYTAYVDSLVKEYKNSPYKVAISKFDWGSNGDVASRAASLLDGYLVLKNPKYLEAGLEGLNYLLGRNPTGYCFVTGFGTKSPLRIHDRRSGADGIAAPIPGYLVGGPNATAGADSGAAAYPSQSPAKRYLDAQSSYSTNEIAINWNAPFVCLVAMVEGAKTALR